MGLMYDMYEALVWAREALAVYEEWDGECPMNPAAELNATIIEPLLERYEEEYDG